MILPLTQLQTFFVHERLKISEAYSEPIQASQMELFTKISLQKAAS